MDRRRFLRSSLALGAAAPLGLELGAATGETRGGWGGSWTRIRGRGTEVLRLDGARLNADLQALRRFGGTPDGGTHRVAYSDEDLGAREWVLGLMRDAGLRVSTDAAGNLVGELPGTDPGLVPLAMGSHIDTVPFGGSYDGTVGVLAAVESVRTLSEAGRRLRHPLRVYVFQNEEGGKTGSRLLVGAVAAGELELMTASGHTIGEGIARLGGNPEDLSASRLAPGSLAGFLELHIEQGGTLERRGVPVGVVEGIVGIRRWLVTVTGEKNHAGTTPMDQRRDALVSASRMVVAVNQVARTRAGRHVATVGSLQVEPGAANVIPGTARFTLEIRDLTMEGIAGVFSEVEAAAGAVAAESGTAVELEPYYLSEAAPSREEIRREVEAASAALGLSSMRLPSGAGHDAQSMAKLCPMGMIFVPSRGGISHAPAEYTSPDQITAGGEVLLGTLLALDSRAD